MRKLVADGAGRTIVAMCGSGFSMEPDNYGALSDGYGADDGAALVFRNTDLAEVVAPRPAARGYRVVRGPTGDAIETELPTRYFG